MSDWIPWIVGAPILIFFAAAVIAFIFGMIIEGLYVTAIDDEDFEILNKYFG